jgi:hypothetical protein
MQITALFKFLEKRKNYFLSLQPNPQTKWAGPTWLSVSAHDVAEQAKMETATSPIVAKHHTMTLKSRCDNRR